MRKLIKILVVIAGLAVALAITASVVLHIYLPPEKAKALVLQHLSAQLKREVDVGSVSVGLLSGLEMSKLRISESPNFSKGVFISSDLFSLKISLVPLIFRKVIVRQILLKHPVVSVVRDADGKTFNFSDLTSDTTPQTPGQPSAGTADNGSFPFVLLVSRAEIQKGALHFVDHSPDQQSMDVSDLDLVLKNVSLTAPFGVQTAMRVTAKDQRIGIHLTGQANLASNSFKITTASVEVGPIKATITGTLNDLKSAQPSCKLHVETNDIAIREALKYTSATVPEGIVLDGSTKGSVDVSGTATNAQFAAKWIGTQLLVAKGEDFVKPTGVPLEVSVIGTRPSENEVVIKSLVAKLGPNEVTGSGTYRTVGKTPSITFAASGKDWSVQELAKVSPLLAPYHPTGKLSFDLHAAGPMSAPQTSGASSAALTFAKFKQDYYEGQDLQLNWNLTDITPDLAKVNGAASLKQGPGRILNIDKLAASSKIGHIVLAPLTTLAKIQSKGLLKEVNLPSLQSIPFDSMVGDYALKSGTVNIKMFDLNGKDLSITNQGTVGLAGAQPIHINVAMKLAAGSVGGTLGELTKDENGRPTIRFLATGTADNPNVKLDIHEVSQKALQKAGEEIMKNKDVQNAVDDIQKSLKGIFH